MPARRVVRVFVPWHNNMYNNFIIYSLENYWKGIFWFLFWNHIMLPDFGLMSHASPFHVAILASNNHRSTNTSFFLFSLFNHSWPKGHGSQWSQMQNTLNHFSTFELPLNLCNGQGCVLTASQSGFWPLAFWPRWNGSWCGGRWWWPGRFRCGITDACRTSGSWNYWCRSHWITTIGIVKTFSSWSTSWKTIVTIVDS